MSMNLYGFVSLSHFFAYETESTDVRQAHGAAAQVHSAVPAQPRGAPRPPAVAEGRHLPAGGRARAPRGLAAAPPRLRPRGGRTGVGSAALFAPLPLSLMDAGERLRQGRRRLPDQGPERDCTHQERRG